MLIEYAPEAEPGCLCNLSARSGLARVDRAGRGPERAAALLKSYIRQEVIESAEPIYDVDGVYPSGSKPMPKKPDKDRLRLLDMRDAAEKARRIASGQRRADLENNEMLELALVKAVEIIGEAANSCQRRNAGAWPRY